MKSHTYSAALVAMIVAVGSTVLVVPTAASASNQNTWKQKAPRWNYAPPPDHRYRPPAEHRTPRAPEYRPSPPTVQRPAYPVARPGPIAKPGRVAPAPQRGFEDFGGNVGKTIRKTAREANDARKAVIGR